MARRKRTSPAVDRAKARTNGLESIDANLDLGNSLTLAAYKLAIADAETKLNDYNRKLSELDADLNVLEATEGTLEELSSRMLAGVGVKFGKDSAEYEQAGGTRSSERKSPARKPQPQPVAVS